MLSHQPKTLTAREPPNLPWAPEQAAPPLLERIGQCTAGKMRREGSLEAQLLGSFPSGGGPFPPDFLQGPQSAPFLGPALQLLLPRQWEIRPSLGWRAESQKRHLGSLQKRERLVHLMFPCPFKALTSLFTPWSPTSQTEGLPNLPRPQVPGHVCPGASLAPWGGRLPESYNPWKRPAARLALSLGAPEIWIFPASPWVPH